MWNLAFRSLWANRKKNIWLILELIVIVIICWKIIDTVTVNHYSINRELGYDHDNLYFLSLSTLMPNDSRYDSLLTGENECAESIDRLCGTIRKLPGVVAASPAVKFQIFENTGNMSSNFFTNDTTQWSAEVVIEFVPGTDFFTTLGIPDDNAEKLSNMPYSDNDIIIDDVLAEAAFPQQKAVGQQIILNPEERTFGTVAGVIKHVIPKSCTHDNWVIYQPKKLTDFVSSLNWGGYILVRTRPDVSDKDFRETIQGAKSQLRSGNYFISGMIDFDTHRQEYYYRSGKTSALRLNTALALFFGISLCLGVVGTFYLQTRRRSEEAGIMRSYGATSSYVIRELLLEGFILVTATWLVGCLIYLHYALKEGLALTGQGAVQPVLADWTYNFALHYTIVSLIVYLILLVIVSAGIFIPARRISRIKPVDALRDE